MYRVIGHIRWLNFGFGLYLAGLGVLFPATASGLGKVRNPFACKINSDKSPAQTSRGQYLMVASAHPEASAAGCKVLLQGGTAADAAIAVQMVLSVVEPQSSGLGGGSIILYYDRAKKQIRFFDGLSVAPQAVTAGLLTPTEDEQKELGVGLFGPSAFSSGRSVGVPGTVAVLDLVHREFGAKPWKTLFDRSIELAEEGFSIAPYLFEIMSEPMGELHRCAYPDLGARYCTENQPLPIGTKVSNPKLGEALKVIREGGASAFYDPQGSIASAIVDRVGQGEYKLGIEDGKPASIPGLLSAKDFSLYQATERLPLCADLLDRTICTAAPPSFGGISVLYQIHLMERGHVKDTRFGSVARVHLGLEASRLAQLDRRAYIGDPKYSELLVEEILYPAYLDARFTLFSPDEAIGMVKPGDLDEEVSAISENMDEMTEEAIVENDTTSHISIVDEYGNAISMTTTLNASFGAHMEAMGITLNNAQTNFTRIDSLSFGQQVNGMEPGKRPRTSMAPTMVISQANELELVVGAAGGSSIPDYVVQTILGVTLDGLSPQQAVSLPHWSGQTTVANCSGHTDALSALEDGKTPELIFGSLESLGHPCVRPILLRSGLTAISLTEEGLLGGADPRRDGAAIGF